MNISNLAEMYWRTCSVLRRSTHNFRPPRSAWLVLVFLGLGNEREINVVWYDVYIYIWYEETKRKKKLGNQKVEAPSFQIFQSCFFFSLYTVIVCRGASLASPSLRDWQTLKGMQGVAAATSASSPSSPSVASSSSSYCHHQQFTNGISSSISDVLGPWRYLVFPLKLLSFFLLVWSVMHETKACLWSTRACRPWACLMNLQHFPDLNMFKHFNVWNLTPGKLWKILYAAATSFLRTQTASRKFPCGGNLVRHQAVNSNKFKSRPSPDCNPAFTGSRTSAPNQLKLAVVGRAS